MKTRDEINDLIIKAESGDAAAQNDLGCAYYNGDGIEKNIAKAMNWFEISAAAGNMYAQSNLAYRYRWGTDGYTKDLTKAFELYTSSAEQGYASSEETLGIFYDYGYGTSKDYAKAVDWYKKAANKGRSLAQNNLGVKYENGQGVEQDYRKAFEWYKKAANQKEPYAQCNIGILYEEGKGMRKDLKKALYWYRESAAQGHDRAKKRMHSLLDTYDENMSRNIYTASLFTSNPHRVLGVYVNGTAREIAANKSKASAFAKINKPVSFPTDKLAMAFYKVAFPAQLPMLDDVSSDTSIHEVYLEIRKCLKDIDDVKSSSYFYDYDQTDMAQFKKHRELKRRMSSLRDEEQRLYNTYEAKARKLLNIGHSLEDIERAVAELNQPTDKLKYAFFWFANLNDCDKQPLAALEQGNIKEAENLWADEEDLSSLFNGAILAFLSDDVDLYVHNITKILHEEGYRNEFINIVCGETFSISEDEIAHLFIDTLLSVMPDEDWKEIFYEHGVSADDDDYLSSVLAKESANVLLTKVKETAAIDRSQGEKRYEAALSLKILTKTELASLSELVGEDSILYQQVADKVAHELYDCAIDYYRECCVSVYKSTQQCVDLNQYAYDIAVGSTLKGKLSEGLAQIKEKLNQLPPERVFSLFGKIETLISEFVAGPFMELSEDLLKKSAPILAEIKEELGSKDKAYIAICTKVTSNCLFNIIEDLNVRFETVDKLLKENDTTSFYFTSRMEAYLVPWLEQARQLFVNMDQLPMEEAFLKDKYTPNRDTVNRHLNNFHVSGVCVPTIDLRSETEQYKACVTVSDLDAYLVRFPHGKYRFEAQKRKEIIVAGDNAYWEECKRLGKYESYLTKYKFGIHKTEAIRLIEERKRKEEDDYWNACSKTGSYATYLEKYPKGIHTKDAMTFTKRRKKVKRMFIVLAVIITLFAAIAMIWGPSGFAYLFGIVAAISFLVATGRGDTDIETRAICLLVGAVCGLICYVIVKMFNL